MHDADRIMFFAVLCLRLHKRHVHLIDHVKSRVDGPGAHVGIGGWWRRRRASGEIACNEEIAVRFEMQIAVGLTAE